MFQIKTISNCSLQRKISPNRKLLGVQDKSDWPRGQEVRRQACEISCTRTRFAIEIKIFEENLTVVMIKNSDVP